jgi:hypothetical protein
MPSLTARAIGTLISRQRAAHERHLRRAAVKHIFAELPSMTFGEACAVKAAQGDQLAQQYTDYFNSREFRLETALADAAIAVHPGWREEADGTLTKLDDNAPEVTNGSLVEWFQKNYPK